MPRQRHDDRMSAPRAGTGASRRPADRHRSGVRIRRRRRRIYLPVGDEIAVFERCHARRLPVMLKGPTGCGKTRFVEHMAWRLGRPLVTVACHDDLSASDLTGRYLVRGGETVWQDGPLTLRGAGGRHLLSRRDRRGAAGHGRGDPSADRRPADAAHREDRRADRGGIRISSSSSPTTRATSTCSRT